MTYDEWQYQLEELKDILTERLEYSKHWGQVSLETKKTFWRIRWYDNKEYYDPKGKILFKETRIAPLNKDFLKEEIKRQKKKLKRDRKDWIEDEDVG